MVIPFMPFRVRFEGKVYEVLAVSDNPETTYFMVADAADNKFWWVNMEDCQPVKED